MSAAKAFPAALSLVLTSLVITAPAAHAESYLQLNTGMDYSSGDYGEAVDTDFLAVPLGLKYQSGDFYLKASTAWVEVSGPSGVIPGDGGVKNPGGTVTSRSGLGDSWLAAGYSLGIGANTWFDAVGKVKLPTASKDKALGTGTTDLVAQGELLHSFGPVSVAAFGGRRFNGSSDRFVLRDVWLAGAGVYANGERTTFGLDYDWREGATLTSPDVSELTGSVTYKLSEKLRLQGYAYTGLADGSPDLGGGVQVLFRFGGK